MVVIESRKIMNKIIKIILSKLVICLVDDKMIGT